METDGIIDLKTSSQSIPFIDIERCTGCGRCVAACPLRCITLTHVKYHKCAEIIKVDLCTGCNLCSAACPVSALHSNDGTASQGNSNDC